MRRRVLTSSELGSPATLFILNQFLSPDDVSLWPYSFFQERSERGNFSPNASFKNQSRIKAEFDGRRGKAIVD